VHGDIKTLIVLNVQLKEVHVVNVVTESDDTDIMLLAVHHCSTFLSEFKI